MLRGLVTKLAITRPPRWVVSKARRPTTNPKIATTSQAATEGVEVMYVGRSRKTCSKVKPAESADSRGIISRASMAHICAASHA